MPRLRRQTSIHLHEVRQPTLTGRELLLELRPRSHLASPLWGGAFSPSAARQREARSRAAFRSEPAERRASPAEGRARCKEGGAPRH